ncbi:MAG: bifunctional riboflavin kinase/FAD synthetase [candidate division KSB1 bacterium]|nr:bifunctional riboflavin kinase/FAD synthetase [candidate division KSB1 bacterium]MDZ7318970.1 bifunctional riboflavin kinase/FAD synthetase [candidate division KSB1 bacterium]MDZ7340568.1 bifunctional riboflavin kinase/FAD synthetase [candidate division KSB1 bacterium]
MEVFRDLTGLSRNPNCVITTGTFDGVHLGHQSIIRKLHDEAQSGECITIVTFEPHPQFILKRQRRTELKLLSTIEEKIAIFESLRIDRLIVLKFDEAFAQISSRQFVEDILVKQIGFRKIIIGYDHAFGRDRLGNQEILTELSQQYHYAIITLPPLTIDGIVVSSTKIRNLLAAGNIEQANRLLGRPYRLSGEVIRGEGRGRTLSVPTANIQPNSREKLIPRHGIYAVQAHLGTRLYKAVLYIGTKPTFSYPEQSIELHLFDFAGNLYGQMLTIEFIARIRDDVQFETSEQLIKQIEIDKQKTLEILATI